MDKAALEKISVLFDKWDDTMIWSCLQGRMGYAMADDEDNPTSAQIVSGDFCFFAGRPDAELIKKAGAPIITPQNEAWCRLIEETLGDRVVKETRYAIKKEPDIFDTAKLKKYAESVDSCYEIRLFGREEYNQANENGWSEDFCSQFCDYEDFAKRGIAVGALYGGQLVAGASSYTVYDGGIEIEIDTKPEFRRKGLATACGARLILECLDRKLYPSWDAHDLRSVALAEKLGYHMDKPYPVYVIQ